MFVHLVFFFQGTFLKAHTYGTFEPFFKVLVHPVYRQIGKFKFLNSAKIASTNPQNVEPKEMHHKCWIGPEPPPLF